MRGGLVARQRLSGALVVLTGAAALAACGGRPTAASPTTSAPSTVGGASTSAPADAAATAALAAYNGMWADDQAAAVTADYQSPQLAQHASGAALSLLVRGLYSYRLKHEVVKGQPVTHARVTSLTPAESSTRASVLDCLDDTHWLVYKASGGLQDNVPGGHRRITATVTDLGGVWKVTQFSGGVEGTC